ncbi:hypothetical protein ONE63_005801 [Megalurothrips usitatus]|uniref:Uncharacterized protein n=1 Tax=Megalurothrips usitatus TaxID=439358 RepID=A0AAV7XXQ6_9NEOP|nr:hypothetical protein ONE63_005801 [Megalurothrips usitatus]
MHAVLVFQAIKKKHDKDVDDPRALEIIRSKWEREKKKLSRIPVVRLSHFLPDVEVDFEETVRRDEFYEACNDLFGAIVEEVEATLKRSGVKSSDVHDVVLVGASTRIPRLRELIQKALGGKPLCTAVNPDEAVAKGAALLAAKWSWTSAAAAAACPWSTSSTAHVWRCGPARGGPCPAPGVLMKNGAGSGSGPIIGIDLGTTYSVVAICRKGRVEVVCDDTGSRTVPSIVGFMGKEQFVGAAAKDLPSESQVFDAKRLIGRPWQDVMKTENREHWPFVVFEDRGVARVRVRIDGRVEDFAPEEISAMVLRHMKEMAEGFLGEPVSRAVVTVPAYFNERQRQATKLAARVAGLEVAAMINEPTAAAVAYGLDKTSGTAAAKKTIFIYDLGGGTFDVSVMTVHGSEFTVLATGGDAHLGGQDFNSRLVEFIREDIRTSHNIKLDSESIQELRRACEVAKRKLSKLPEVSISVFFSRHKLGYKKTLTRACFEDLCIDLFKRTIQLSEQVLADSKVPFSAIDEVVLVGGSTHIPRVRELLKTLFHGKEPRKSINVDEAVAYGAAVHAAVLKGDKFYENLVRLRDVTPLSLGVNVLGGRFSTVIPKNTPVPCEKTKVYGNSHDYQTECTYKVYQGERAMSKDNHDLNKTFTIPVPPKPAGQVEMDCTFKIDSDGLLTVTAVERSTGAAGAVTIYPDEARVSEEEVQKMLKNAERFRRQDLEEKRRVEAELGLKGLSI